MLSKNKIKYIQSLHQKKQRDELQLFVAEGDKIVQTILQQKPGLIHSIYALQNWQFANRNLLKNTEVIIVTNDELQRLSAMQTPNQVLCVAHIKSAEVQENPSQQWVLALDGIQDPGNLGTIIRLADWFGIKEIICNIGTVDCYNPKVIQSTMGSFTQVNICYCDLHNYIQSHKNVKIYAALLDGQNVARMQLNTQNGIIVIGNEGNGITQSIIDLCNTPISIKGKGKAESLNAAIATGIILSHLVK
jgi:RNA methyltransferase, TrmH family